MTSQNFIKKRIIQISDEILDFLLKYRADNPGFTFPLRERDSIQSDEKRLEIGQWFQGSDYINVPLFKKGDTNRKIKTIGFFLDFNEDGSIKKNYISISFRGGITSEDEINFHKELASELQLTLNENNFGLKQFPDPSKYVDNLEEFIGDVRNKALSLLSKYNIADKYLVSEEEFQRNLNKITLIKTSLNKNKLVNEMNSESKSFFPLNQILYGPPGTGKTYKLYYEYFPKFTQQGKIVEKNEYEYTLISELPWWKVLALIISIEGKLNVPQIKKHRFVEYKLRASNTNSLNQTVWGQLSAHAVTESTTVKYSRRAEPFFLDKNDDSFWHIVPEKKELISDIFEMADKIKNFKEEKKELKNYKFVTFHQSFTYEDFIEGIKPKMNSEDDSESTGEIEYHIEDGIFYKCCDEAAKLAGFINLKDCIDNFSLEDRITRYQAAPGYAIFIDEINRGNISAILGELITLLEDDKRLARNELIVELPYSKRKFGVPPNLYIIGTMNTADRSVEALDTALRRRFSFEEMLPDLTLLTGIIKLNDELPSIKLRDILEIMNARIGKLLDKDHMIGHSYFMCVSNLEDLKAVFYHKIIPLLQEYFFGDYGKIGLVIGKGFFEDLEQKNKEGFADFNYDTSDIEGRIIYKLKNVITMEEGEFIKALNKLLNKTDAS